MTQTSKITDRNSRSPFHVPGVRVDAVQIPDMIAQMEEWIRECAQGQ